MKLLSILLLSVALSFPQILIAGTITPQEKVITQELTPLKTRYNNKVPYGAFFGIGSVKQVPVQNSKGQQAILPIDTTNEKEDLTQEKTD